MNLHPLRKEQTAPSFDIAFYSNILESVSDPVFVKDAQHRWVYVNQAFCDFVGYDQEQLLGASDYDFFPAEQAEIFWRKDNLVFETGQANENRERVTRSDHRQRIITTRKSILSDSQGRRYLLGVIKDITDAVRRENHHKQIARLLKSLILGASQVKLLRRVLRAAEEALPGVIATVLRLDQETQRLHPALPSGLPEEYVNAIDGTPARRGMGSCGEAAFLKQRVIVEDIASHPNWTRVSEIALRHQLRACWSQPVFNFDGDVIGTFALYFRHEATPDPFDLEVLTTLGQLTSVALEYHRIEKETLNLRTLMANMINAMPSMLMAVDSRGRVVQWNAEAEEVTGISAAAAHGAKLAEVLPLTDEQLQRIHGAIAERRTLNWARISHPWAGGEHWLDLTLYPIDSRSGLGSVIRIDDVTKQVRLGQMMVQTEKIHSLGGLAAGMAHEINNPLAGILQNIQILGQRLQKGLKKNEVVAEQCGVRLDLVESYMQQRKIFDLLKTIQTAGCRASNIVNNMLQFSRNGSSEFTFCGLPQLMDSTIALLDTDYNQAQKYDFRKVKVERDYDPGLPKVYCPGSEIQQVFFNLLKNAAQAMADQAEPRIMVRMSLAGSWVRIEVEDRGPGISLDVQQHIFEPFYTTKPVGAGTGLGLSVAYYIMTVVARGKMSVESKPGCGAKFLLELPV